MKILEPAPQGHVRSLPNKILQRNRWFLKSGFFLHMTYPARNFARIAESTLFVGFFKKNERFPFIQVRVRAPNMQRHLPAFQLVYNLRYTISGRIYISTNVSYFHNVNYTLIEMLGDVSARSELELELE